MALVYFDSSALVKLLVEERGSDLAAQLWDAADAAFASRIAYPEVRAALAAAGRNHDLTAAQARGAARDWDAFWDAVRPVELTPAVERAAGDLAAVHALRGADAIHLASVVALGEPDVVVAVWDRRLHAAVLGAGFAAAPASVS